MLVKRIVAILKRFRPSKRGEFASVSPLLAITPIVAHFKSAKLRWRFISRPGAGRQLGKGRRLRIDSASVAANESEPLPGKMSLLLFSLSVVLTALLAIAYITLAEAPAAEAATVPIQTCSGSPSSSTNTDGLLSLAPADVNNPGDVLSGTIPFGKTALLLGRHIAFATKIEGEILPTWVSRTILVPTQVQVPDPNGALDTNGNPVMVTETVMISEIEWKLKDVYWEKIVYIHETYFFNSAIITSPAAGAPDSSSNLTSASTHMRPNVSNPGVNFGHYNHAGSQGNGQFWWGAGSYSHSAGVSGFGGTRKSDGHSFSGSYAAAPNHYSQGTIEAFNWNAGWSVTVNGSVTAYFTNNIVIQDLSWDGGPGMVTPFTDSTGVSASSSTGGTISGCTRTLVVAPPTCTPKLRGDNHAIYPGLLPHKTETFNPNVEHGSGGQTIRIFPVGTDQRTSFTLRNRHNLFSLNPTGNSYSYSRASPYDSGRSPSAGGSGAFLAGPGSRDAEMWSELQGAVWGRLVSNTVELANTINFPGKYRVTWTPRWSSLASSHGWSGSELNGSVCKYEQLHTHVIAIDPEEGPQPHPAVGSVVGSLSLNVHVFADPPTCTVGDFLFEVNEPIVPKVTLSNPNNAPMWVDVADSTISRLGFSRTDVSTTYRRPGGAGQR